VYTSYFYSILFWIIRRGVLFIYSINTHAIVRTFVNSLPLLDLMYSGHGWRHSTIRNRVHDLYNIYLRLAEVHSRELVLGSLSSSYRHLVVMCRHLVVTYYVVYSLPWHRFRFLNSYMSVMFYAVSCLQLTYDSRTVLCVYMVLKVFGHV